MGIQQRGSAKDTEFWGYWEEITITKVKEFIWNRIKDISDTAESEVRVNKTVEKFVGMWARN